MHSSEERIEWLRKWIETSTNEKIKKIKTGFHQGAIGRVEAGKQYLATITECLNTTHGLGHPHPFKVSFSATHSIRPKIQDCPRLLNA